MVLESVESMDMMGRMRKTVRSMSSNSRLVVTYVWCFVMYITWVHVTPCVTGKSKLPGEMEVNDGKNERVPSLIHETKDKPSKLLI